MIKLSASIGRKRENAQTIWLVICHTILALAMWLGLLPLANAHEMGTSALTLKEFTSGTGELVFKRSRSADGQLPPIEFKLSPECTIHARDTVWEGDAEVAMYASFACEQPLMTHQLSASGFMRLAPDLIVTVDPLQPTSNQGITEPKVFVLNPARPSVNLSEQIGGQSSQADLQSLLVEYGQLGMAHIVLGLDHVLFITGLFLLWRAKGQSLKALLVQFSLFTLGHAVSLTALQLGTFMLPVRTVESLIALSIFWLAVELAYQPARALEIDNQDQQNQQHQQTNRHATSNYLLIVLFGLVHGSGFAASMLERGFPQEALISTLLSFNLGIELGQLLIVALLMSIFKLLSLGEVQPKILSRKSSTRSVTQNTCNTDTANHIASGNILPPSFIQGVFNKPITELAHISLVILLGGFSLLWTIQRFGDYLHALI